MNIITQFNNKTVLVTGHTGFKGSWLSAWLSKLGANVVGLSNRVPTHPSHFDLIEKTIGDDKRIDIKDFQSVSSIYSVKRGGWRFPIIKFSSC